MRTRPLPLLSSTLLAIFLSACTITEPIGKSATQHNRAVGETINRTLLLNVLRAADREPKTYTGVSTITGQGSASPEPRFSFGLSSDASDNLSLSLPFNGATAAFTVNVHNSKEFAQGLFDPVSIQQLAHFWNQGWSRSMILMLAVQSVTITEYPCNVLHNLTTATPIAIRNEDGVEGCRAAYINQPSPGLHDVRHFAHTVDTMLAADLIRLEPQTLYCLHTKATSVSDLEKLEKLRALDGVRVTGRDDSVATVKDDSVECKEAQDGANFTVFVERPNFVLSLGQGQRPARLFMGTKKVGVNGGGTIEVRGSIRSTEGLIHYLGQLLRFQGADPVRTTDDRYECRSRVLFDVRSGPGTGDSLVGVRHRGKNYSIPLPPRSATCPPLSGTVLSFVRQALALNSSDKDSPSAGLVLVGVD